MSLPRPCTLPHMPTPVPPPPVLSAQAGCHADRRMACKSQSHKAGNPAAVHSWRPYTHVCRNKREGAEANQAVQEDYLPLPAALCLLRAEPPAASKMITNSAAAAAAPASAAAGPRDPNPRPGPHPPPPPPFAAPSARARLRMPAPAFCCHARSASSAAASTSQTTKPACQT